MRVNSSVIRASGRLRHAVGLGFISAAGLVASVVAFFPVHDNPSAPFATASVLSDVGWNVAPPSAA
jgi:hypothetical protein